MLAKVISFLHKKFLLLKMKYDNKYQFHDLSLFVDRVLLSDDKKTNSLVPALKKETGNYNRVYIFGHEYDSNCWTIEESIKHHNNALAVVNETDKIKFYYVLPAYYAKLANGNWSIISMISCESHTILNYGKAKDCPTGFLNENDKLEILDLNTKAFSMAGYPANQDVVLKRVIYKTKDNNIN